MKEINSGPTVSMDLTNIFLDYIAKIGIDPDELCKLAGIETSELKEKDERRISVDRFGVLWDAAVKKSDDPDFGLHSIKDISKNIPGGHILFSVVLNCSTVEQALKKFFRYHALMNNVINPKMELDNDFFYVTWDLFDPEFSNTRQISEALLCVYFYILTNLTQNKMELVEVHFAHQQPENISEHKNIFQVPLKFEQPLNQLVVKREILDLPLYWANPKLLKTLEHFAETSMEKIHPEKTWTNKTIDSINQKMANGEKITLKLIAGTMGLSIRNLQNKLNEEDNNFQTIFNDLRKNIAFQYLKRKDVAIMEVAFLLGFSEQSSFNHAFKRWTGTTPKEYMKNERDKF